MDGKPELLILQLWPDLTKINALVKNIMAQMGIDDPVEAIRRVNSGEWVVKFAELLKQVATVTVGGVERFCAKDHLEAANIGWTDTDFERFFLDKVEENVGTGVLAIHRLERQSPDALIMTELGDRAEIQLAHFFELLEAQSEGEEGPLLVDGRSNYAHIRGTDGNVRAVYTYWSAIRRYWNLRARQGGDYSNRLSGGNQVLSR